MNTETAAVVPHDLEERIAALIKENFLEVPGELEPTADLFALGLDSMGIMQLLILIEQSFGVRIQDRAVTQDNFRSPVRIAELIRGINADAR
jgi:acyl carrier protein